MYILSLIVFGSLAIFLASLIAGLTGFGFSLIAVPTLIIFLSPKIVVPSIILLSMLINLIILYESRKWVDLKRILPLILGGFIGIPFGTYLLFLLNVNLIKLLIGAFIVIFAIFFSLGFKKKVKNEKLAFLPVGFISGVLNGSTSMSGPPIILFFTNQGVEKEVFRANLIAYFTVLNIFTLMTFVYSGLITSIVINYSLIFIPALALGTLIGVNFVHKIKEKLFRTVTLIILIVTGLILIVSVLLL